MHFPSCTKCPRISTAGQEGGFGTETYTPFSALADPVGDIQPVTDANLVFFLVLRGVLVVIVTHLGDVVALQSGVLSLASIIKANPGYDEKTYHLSHNQAVA